MSQNTARDGLTRRQILQAGAAIGGALAAPSLLTACGKELPPAGVNANGEWRNWSGSQVSQPKAWLRPTTEAELAQQLRAASGSVRVTGASHSFSAVCRTDDTLLSIDALKGIVDHDPESLQATIWAGTRLRDLGEPLWGIGQSLINQGDVDPQSLAGACGTSTHGTGVTLGSFSATVRGLRVVTPQGEVIDADADHNAEVFRAGMTSLGVLGVISQLRIQNRKPYKLKEREYVETLDTVLSTLPTLIASNRHFEFFSFIETDQVIVKTLNETDEADTPPPRFALPVDGVLDLTATIAHTIEGMDAPMQKLLTLLHSETHRIGPAHRIFPSQRNSRFNEMEYELPLERGAECLQEIIATIRKSAIRTLFPIEFRTVAADEAWLSPFYGRSSASISIHQFHRVDYRPLFDLVEPIFWKYQARPHWGKLHRLDAQALAKLYPRWEDFQAVRKRLDPEGKMLNAHLKRALLSA